MKQKIKIIGMHPHAGEFAEIEVSERGTVKSQTILGKIKFRVDLIDCPHAVDSCFVGEGEFILA